MELEVLISTMNVNSKQENIELIRKMNVTGKSLTISQTNKKGEEQGKNRIIYDNKRGLSRSRNIALKNAKADIVLLADNDVKYNDDYEEIIKKAYEENPNADVIAFYMESLNPNRKIRRLRKGKITWFRIFSVLSTQLSFKLESMKNIKFDENFGAGTKNYCGEENILLSDCLRKHMNVIYVDKQIGTVEQKESTWYKEEITEEYMEVEKNCFKRIAPKWWRLLWIKFIVKNVIPRKIRLRFNS